MAIIVTYGSTLNASQPLILGGTYSPRFSLSNDILPGELTVQSGRTISPFPGGLTLFGNTATLTYSEILAPGASVTYTAINQLLIDFPGFPIQATANAIKLSAIGSTI